MNLKHVPCDGLNRSKNLIISNDYVISLTGKTVFILNKNLQILGQVSGLSYVYRGEVSTDQSKLLLISNSNRFYIVSLDTFQIVNKHTIQGEYNGNLEGKGIWSFDGKRIIIPITNRKKCMNIIRSYSSNDLKCFEDFLPEKYQIKAIFGVKKLDKYVLIGSIPREYITENYIIFFNGKEVDEIPIKGYYKSILSAEYDEKLGRILLYELGGTCFCDFFGNITKSLAISEPINITANFSDSLSDLSIELQNSDELKKLYAYLSMDNLSIPEYAYKVCLSQNKRYLYIATVFRFIIYDIALARNIYSKAIENGVQNITELDDNIIILNTYSGAKVYKLYE